jgi:hypothetical protein
MDRKLLNRFEFHFRRAVDGSASDKDWAVIVEVLEKLLAQKPDAQTNGVAKLLQSAAAALRSWHLPSDWGRLSKELEQAKTRVRVELPRERSFEDRAAELVRGRELLLLGGDRRNEHAESLRTSLGLSELHWPQTREDTPDVGSFEPWIARVEVVAVVLLIRWSRHAYGEVSGLCDRYGKPLVRIEAGYNAVQIARGLVEQASERLRRS